MTQRRACLLRLDDPDHSGGSLPSAGKGVGFVPEIDPGRDAANVLLALSDPPTAIFAFNDDIAIGALQAAQARGLRGPAHLSTVGFDDVEHRDDRDTGADHGPPTAGGNGTTAVSLLSRFLDGQNFETLHVELATRLVVRDSTAPPRKA